MNKILVKKINYKILHNLNVLEVILVILLKKMQLVDLRLRLKL